MGVIAESIVAYAQPLLDGTDGSAADMRRAIDAAQAAFRTALALARG